MTSPPQPGPRRQDSTVSSTSSSNRTIRASSQSGRRRSPTSTSTSTATGLLARLTGRSNGKKLEDSSFGSEDEELMSMHGSRNSPPGLQAKTSRDEGLEAGPSDYWRRTPSLQGSPISLPVTGQEGVLAVWSSTAQDHSTGVWHPTASSVWPAHPTPPTDLGETIRRRTAIPDGERFDNIEYERRMRDLLAHPAERINGTGLHKLDSHDGNIAISRKPGFGDLEGQLEEGFRDVVDLANWADHSGRELEEEEIGVHAIPPKDGVSERTVSPSSESLAGREVLLRSSGVVPSPLRGTPYLHPSVSRLRSHLRTTSSTTQQSSFRPPTHSRTPSHFSQISMTHSDSISTTSQSRLPMTDSPAEPPEEHKDQSPAFTFHPLRQMSAHLFSRKTAAIAYSPRPPARRTASSMLGAPNGKQSAVNGEFETSLGSPTVMDARGMIAVGTQSGRVVVYGFDQEVKCILGSDGMGPVTAVTISSDRTYIGVGHASGNIHLYDLSNPVKPARTTLALTLRQVLSGRKEGHLQGSRILQVGFVGARHTSITSGDEHGRAFWWSLGKVIGVESNDVVRMLGSYPDKEVDIPPHPSKRPTTLFAVLPLPLGDTSHTTDEFQLSALLTSTKLVIVGMKPQAKTWFRKSRDNTGGEAGGLVGCTHWLRSGEVEDGSDASSDPVLAYSWGTAVRFVRVRAPTRESTDISLPKGVSRPTLTFVEGRKWEAPHPVQALFWFDQNHIVLITSAEVVLLDVRPMTLVENTPLQSSLLVGQPSYSGLGQEAAQRDLVYSLAGSVRTHRGKLFLLTKGNFQVGSLLHWNDRILARVHRGDLLGAIRVALAYFEDRAPGNVIGLPSEAQERRTIIGTRIRELMRASLGWAFSDDRMRDDTHYSIDGRGVDLTGLFEGLASSCIEACISMNDASFLFDDAFEHFAAAGIQGMFLRLLEPYIFDGRVLEIPPNIIQALISTHDEHGEFQQAEAIIWHVEPTALDINQAIRLCEAHGLWDALIHVYTRAMRDYVAPIVKLIRVVQEVQSNRLDRPSLVGENDGQDPESLAPDAYKLFAYMENVLSGLSYPSGEELSDAEGTRARSEVYGFLFSGRPVIWPDGPDGELIAISDSLDDPYPYLILLLHFDTEAFLHAMDIAFEDPYLNDTRGAISRQSVVDVMLEVMKPDIFHTGQITFLHIFVSRNLPKYTQFLHIPPSILQLILVSLSSDPDQSTREDRQLAAEYLLSAYTPQDAEAMNKLFDDAGFFRILRATYRKDRKWAPLISTFLKDPESGEEIFTNLDEIIQESSFRSNFCQEVTDAMTEALPHLLDSSVRQTALLLEKDLPSIHDLAVQNLRLSEHKQMAYLRCLLEPSIDDQDEKGPLPILRTPSAHISMSARHQYVSLLCRNDSSTVVTFLDARGPTFFDIPRLADECDRCEFYEGQLWALDRQGKTEETFDTVGRILRLKGADLGQGIVSHDTGTIHMALQTLRSVSRMAVRLCQEHSTGRTGQAEEMWFAVLSEIVELVHSVAGLAQPTPQKAIADHQIDDFVIDSIRSVMQETLQSLVSSSSQSLSFPRLFKRLVETSTPATKAKKGSAYSEFRTILTGMLDSYRAECDMLSMTTRLVEADLFVSVQEISERRQRGWRPMIRTCDNCGEAMFAGNETDTTGQGSAVAVLGSGRWWHVACKQDGRLDGSVSIVGEIGADPLVAIRMRRSI